MAFTAIPFTCMITIIFSAISVATSNQTQPQNFISPNYLIGSQNGSFENILAHQVKNEDISTFERIIRSNAPKHKENRWNLQISRNRNGHPALLGLMDYSTGRVPQENFVVPAVLTLKKQTNGPASWIWGRLWVHIG